MTAGTLNARLVKAKLSLSAFSMLGECRSRPHTINELAKSAGVSIQAASMTVERLENKKLVERSRENKDRRKVSVNITEAGKQLLGGIEG